MMNRLFQKFLNFFRKANYQSQTAGDNAVCIQTSSVSITSAEEAWKKLYFDTCKSYEKMRDLADEAIQLGSQLLIEKKYILGIIGSMDNVPCLYLTSQDTSKKCPFWTPPTYLEYYPDDDVTVEEWQDFVFGKFDGKVRCSTPSAECVSKCARAYSDKQLGRTDV